MKRAVPWVLMGSMAFLIVVLLLNLREKDYYDGGSLAPPEGDGPSLDPLLPALIPSTVVHVCPSCGECTHPVEIAENQRVLSLRDHDGWYKFFWAGDETYYFEDPIFLAACLQNRTARDPRGTWTLRARLGPATHAAGNAHACGEILSEFRLSYAFMTSESPIAEEAAPLGPFRFPRVIQAFARPYGRSHLPEALYFGWRLASPESAVGSPAPCPCGKP